MLSAKTLSLDKHKNLLCGRESHSPYSNHLVLLCCVRKDDERFVKFSETLTKQHIFRLVQIESIGRRQNRCNLKTKIVFGMGRKHCGKRRKCWLPAFSPSPTMFSKGFFFRFFKNRDCVVMSFKVHL